MHPLIAFLAFIFSPSDDWLLRQSFELYIDPERMPAVVQSYNDILHQYPTFAGTGEKAISADAAAQAMWAEALSATGNIKDARQQWGHLQKDKSLPDEMRDHVQLRVGETALADGNREEARHWLDAVAARVESPLALEAKVDLLVCDLADGRAEDAIHRAHEITSDVGTDAPPARALFALGLTAYASGHYSEAMKFFSQGGDDAKALYFLGLTLRKLNKPQDALTAWEGLRRYGTDRAWARLADVQLAETFFSVGDDALCRTVCERSLAEDPETPHRDRFAFRLASLDMRHGDYNQALARLTPLLGNDELGQRTTELVAESMSKTGHSHDLYKALAQRRKGGAPSAESTYQMAWAALADKRMDEAFKQSEQGLMDFLDPDFTPRLLLLQGLVYEHKGKEAEALATYQTIADRYPASLAAAKSTHWLALAYARNGRFAETVTHVAYLWNKLPVEEQRLEPDTEFWIGEAHRRLNRLEDADTHLRTFLALAPSDHRLRSYGYFERATVLAQLKRFPDALAMLDVFQRSATDGKNEEWVKLANLQKGNILYNDRQYVQAIAAYRAAGDNPKALYHQAVALAKLEYYTGAVETWTALAQKFPQDPYAQKGLFRAARTQFEIGQATAAADTFTRFAQAYPDSPMAKAARLQAAHALYNGGNVAAAEPLYKEYLTRYHETEDVATVAPYLASCYARLNKTEAEAEALLKGLPPTEELASIRWATGAQHYNQKQFAEAQHSFGLMAAETPNYNQTPAGLFYYAESLFQQKNWIDAEQSFAAYLSSTESPDVDQAALAWFHRGVAQFSQDKLLKAADSFEMIAQKYPTNTLAPDARENLYLCYHNLGDWPKEQTLRAKYGTGAAVTVTTVAQVPQNTTAPESRAANEIPSELNPTKEQTTTPSMLGAAGPLMSAPQ